jgi:2-oxoglutarate/2-oxoacid ferredoxin oxidoreductase subunit alpha
MGNVNDMSFRIGGEAGQGVESSGAGFAKALTRGGLHAFGLPDYYSRIRGGHNFFTVRVSAQPVMAVREMIELLLALNAETVSRHVDKLVPGGAIIIDESTHFDEALLSGKDVRVFRVPMTAIAEKEGSSLMANTAALGVAAGLTGFDLRYVVSVIEDNFKRKGEAVVQANRRVAQAAYAFGQEHFGADFPWKLEARPGPQRLNITGNQAFALGALVGGCKFAVGYPMTPATPVLEYLAQRASQWGLVVKHAESEVAAINMLVGAAVAGVRALAPTSGGGYDLMTEGVSLAAITETPVVIYLAQRPGPATGLPTRTAQSDLFLAMYTSHGEFSRIILAPHTPEEMFACGTRAFNLAEKYQCPVIVLSDHYISGATFAADVSAFDVEHVAIERGKLLTPEQIEALDDYKRYALTPDGVSSRVLPGASPKAIYLTTSDEHNERGNISEEPDIVNAMVEKRLVKAQYMLDDMRPPFRYGPDQAEITFVSWGSTYGPLREVVDMLNKKRNGAANLCHFVDLYPFPAQAAQKALAGARKLVCVEGNATGQFAFLLQAYAGVGVQHKVLRYDGRGFTPEYILARLEGK